jgi:hypothetical protein
VYLALATKVLAADFWDTFDRAGAFNDTGTMSESSSPDWWLTSGGRFTKSSGFGRTIQGSLPSNDPLRTGYAKVNPVDTDNGYHPQNIFRMVTRRTWNSSKQTVSFRVNKTNLSSSSHRNNTNGVLLRSRYLDENNMYYVGVRVDGLGIIKKKVNGTYYTLGKAQLWGTASSYDRSANPNLLPLGKWIKLRSDVYTTSDGVVHLKLWVDKGDGKGLLRRIEASDAGANGARLTSPGYGGMRTDFLDVDFENYSDVSYW